MHPPQEVVVRFLRGRCLERRDPRALGVKAAHDVANRAVLARAVHPLKHHEQRAPVPGVHQRLQLVEARDGFLGFLDRRLFLEPERFVGVPIGERERLVRTDGEPVA